jgi:hypothetical protein
MLLFTVPVMFQQFGDGISQGAGSKLRMQLAKNFEPSVIQGDRRFGYCGAFGLRSP